MLTKNVQVIDGAQNCTYDIFATNEDDFALIFPDGRDVEFIEDFIGRVGDDVAGRVCNRLWSARVDKKSVAGIHGTLFYELSVKKKYYPTKREAEMTTKFVK